jgi:hypothetical protein
VRDPDVTYYARVAPGERSDRPLGLFRRRHTRPDPTDESLRRDGQWRPTSTLRRAADGGLDDDVVEIPVAQATEIARRWQEAASQRQADLTAQGRGALGLVVAQAVPADPGDDVRLADFEQVAVAAYLRDAPTVAVAPEPGPDPFDPARAAVVPLHVHTDGLWIWSEALAYFADRYGLPPEPELLGHIRRRDYRWPVVTAEQIDRAAQLIQEHRPG